MIDSFLALMVVLVTEDDRLTPSGVRTKRRASMALAFLGGLAVGVLA